MKTEEQMAEGIAKQLLDVETLETRGSDELDFHGLAVWQIKSALISAFRQGYHHRATNND
jgi:hypothetical protein